MVYRLRSPLAPADDNEMNGMPRITDAYGPAQYGDLPAIASPAPQPLPAIAPDSAPADTYAPGGSVDQRMTDWSTAQNLPPIGRQDPTLPAAAAEADLAQPVIATPTATATTTEAPTSPVDGALTNLYRREADTHVFKDKHWSKWDKIAAALEGWAKGGIFGAVGAVRDPHYFESQRQQRERADILPQIALLEHQRDVNTADAYKRAQTATIKNDDIRQGQAATELADWRKSETARKIGATEARERTSRMNAVAGMFKSLPEFIPGDPKYKEIEQALGDVKLPVTEKDAKKKVDLKQDQRTGAWTVILTNPVTGTQEVRNVEKDGTPFASTPTVVMQGEYGLLKQNDQQDYQAGENQKNREFQASTKAAELQFRQGLKEFDVANGRQKTVENATNAFKKAFYNKNSRNPSQAEIDAYIANVVVPALQ